MISNSEGAFVQRHLIADNILISFEILHAKSGDSSLDGSMAIKLDMSKAFDLVEWPFLASIMLHLSFCQSWVDLVMMCAKSASFSFLGNGAPKGHIISSQGIG